MSRQSIYYWKCDRPAAFHGTGERDRAPDGIEEQLRCELQERFPGKRIVLSPGSSQGNHLTWQVDAGDLSLFARVEHGPERDGQLEVESAVMRRVAMTGVPVPTIAAVDATRSRVPFAWQLMERIPFPDLNHWHKEGSLDEDTIALAIGRSVATWQSIRPYGFGPFADTEACYHSRYEDYFYLRLDAHLGFLMEGKFLTGDMVKRIEKVIAANGELLRLDSACLVHKDLALWNILGSRSEIVAFIDFDDAIGGDPLDDLSLLACFHPAKFLQKAFLGYEQIRPLPEEYRRRFWLHLLRNMIVKSVIRLGAGYFDRDDGFFLIPSGGSGAGLRQKTHDRIQLALDGLTTNADFTLL